MMVKVFAAAALAALAMAGRASGQVEPTIGDIAACNQQAAAETSHPSAYPGARPPAPGGSRPTEPPTEPPSREPGPALDPPAGGGVGERTDPSGSIITQSPDPLLRGMDAERSRDPAYRAAYRQCMQGRIPGGR
jgi:hypothetical protein